jgi:hypothetical protein
MKKPSSSFYKRNCLYSRKLSQLMGRRPIVMTFFVYLLFNHRTERVSQKQLMFPSRLSHCHNIFLTTFRRLLMDEEGIGLISG